MRPRVLVIGAALAIVIGMILYSSLRTTAVSKSEQEKSEASAFRLAAHSRIEVLLNEEQVGTYMSIRFMFLYVDALDFNEQNLSHLFATVAEEHRDPPFLQITAYSDKEMLDRAISRYRDQSCGVWPEDQLPAKTGYFWAQYSRRDDAEYFSYTPDHERADTTRVWFTKPIASSDSMSK